MTFNFTRGIVWFPEDLIMLHLPKATLGTKPFPQSIHAPQVQAIRFCISGTLPDVEGPAEPGILVEVLRGAMPFMLGPATVDSWFTNPAFTS